MILPCLNFPSSFLNGKSNQNTLCHSFRIIVIPSVLLSFLPDFFHSFHIIVIPSALVSIILNIVIPSKLLPFQIFVALNISSTLPYLKGEKIGRQSQPYLRVISKIRPTQYFSAPFRVLVRPMKTS